jgi:hypothetical protein
MKIILSLLLSSLVLVSNAQSISLAWTTDSTLATPESVLPIGKKLYVSLIDGAGWDADGKGGIGIVSDNGKVINANWVTGLNAPKGMALVSGVLYVADITEIVSIDFKSGKILKKDKINGAIALNDITADPSGTVYVSDSRAGKILTYSNGEAKVLLENLKDVNGVKWHNNKLYLTGNNAFIEYDPARQSQREICKLENGGDGIEPYKDGFYVTSWLGYLYHVDAQGNRKTLRETHQTNKFKTADIGLDQKKGIVYIPTFFGNTVEAWKIGK